MKAVLFSFGRGVASQLSVRMLLLTALPFFLATAVWGVLLWVGLQPVIDAIQRYFADNNGFATSNKWLSTLGLVSLKTVIVPLMALWMFLPLMVVTTLVFVTLTAMPAIVRYVGKRHHPALERRQNASMLRIMWTTVSSLLIFIVLWVVTTPLCAFPLIGFAIQPLLWGWLTCRVIAHDVLARYADTGESSEILRKHRWQLLAIGTMTGILGVAPSLLWLGGVMSIVFFPFFAALSICLYVLVFMFSGLWFTHYGLTAVAEHRRLTAASHVPVEGR